MRVAILGCGPAGLLAAHGAKLLGHQVTIFSRVRKSPMLGAQFLHRAIPGLALSPPEKLAYVLHGTYAGYKDKVYGDKEVDSVSPETFGGFHEAWSIRQAYERMWGMYENLMYDTKIDVAYVASLLGRFDAVLSTIPAKTLCYNQHNFMGQQVWVDDSWHGPETTVLHDHYGTANVVICDGTSINGWYRTSHIFGHANTEWPATSRAPRDSYGRAKLITKPIGSDCNCWSRVIKAGRYGSWMKGVLSHQAFEVALEALTP